ncbi:MAG: DUF2188 domain-containing protein [Bacilli bacterium]|nr:DUF2188 domain-containing protein [Bacilli bacterium]
MTKLHKRVRTATFSLIVLFVLSIGALLVMNVAFSYFADSLANYARFAKSVLFGIFGMNNFKYPTDIMANVSFIIGVVLCLFGLIWMIVACTKRKFSGIAYFFVCAFLGFLTSYAAFLYATVQYGKATFRYALFAFENSDKYSGDIAILIIFTVFVALTFLSIIVLGISHMKYACKEGYKKVKAEKPHESVEKPADRKPEVKEEKVIIFTKAPEEKPVMEAPKVEEHVVKPEEPSEKHQEEIAVENETKVEPKNELKPDEKKVSVKKAEPKKESKPVEKKTSTIKAEPKKESKKSEPKKEPSVKSSGKVYHISQHPTENKWQVKLAKGEKALKLFDTQAEAIAYAKEISKNQGGSIRVHSMAGKIRKA